MTAPATKRLLLLLTMKLRMVMGMLHQRRRPRKRNNDARAKSALFLGVKRVKHRKQVEKGLVKLHQVLVMQRQHFRQYHSTQLNAPKVILSGTDLAQAKKRREVAYQRLHELEADFAQALAEVRAVEVELSPTLNDQPAVFALGVSAPGTSWGTDEWKDITPLPEVTACFKRLLVSAYSPPAPERRVYIRSAKVVRSGADEVVDKVNAVVKAADKDL